MTIKNWLSKTEMKLCKTVDWARVKVKVNRWVILVNPNYVVFFKELHLGFSDQMKNKLWLIIYFLGINIAIDCIMGK